MNVQSNCIEHQLSNTLYSTPFTHVEKIKNIVFFKRKMKIC